MAETTTYATLLAAISSYTEDNSTELTTEAPAIIARGADRCQMDLDLDLFEQSETKSMAYNTETQAFPSGCLRIRSIYIPSEGRHLERRSLAWLQMYGTTTGVPRYYHQQQTDYVVRPIPQNNYTAITTYLKKLAALTVSNTTNWLTDNAAALLLYACLAEAEHFLVAPTRAAEWEAKYQAELARMLKELRGLERDDYQPLRAAAGNG